MTESNATLTIKSPAKSSALASGNVKNNISSTCPLKMVPSIISFDDVFSALIAKIEAVELDQAYYWTKDWQEGEVKADKDIKAKNWDIFSSAKDAIEHLDKLRDGSNKSD